LSSHPTHVEAKREYAKWYRGYQIIIAEVVRSYGDGALEHFTPNDGATRLTPMPAHMAADEAAP
jgi:hypothetical protein